jgi:hypothetical protein
VVFHAGLAFPEKLVGSPEIKQLITTLCSLEGDGSMKGQVELQEELGQAM